MFNPIRVLSLLTISFFAVSSYGQERSLHYATDGLPVLAFDFNGQSLSNTQFSSGWDVNTQGNKQIFTTPVEEANRFESYEYVENTLKENGERVIKYSFEDLTPNYNHFVKTDSTMILNGEGKIKSFVRCSSKKERFGNKEKCSAFDAQFCQKLIDMDVDRLAEQKRACENFANEMDDLYADRNQKLKAHLPELRASRNALQEKFGKEELNQMSYSWETSSSAMEKDMDQFFAERRYCQGNIDNFERPQSTPPQEEDGASIFQ